jgi:hypothetical protein
MADTAIIYCSIFIERIKNSEISRTMRQGMHYRSLRVGETVELRAGSYLDDRGTIKFVRVKTMSIATLRAQGAHLRQSKDGLVYISYLARRELDSFAELVGFKSYNDMWETFLKMHKKHLRSGFLEMLVIDWEDIDEATN